MSEEFKVNLKDFSEKELKAAIKAKQDMDKFQRKPVWAQLQIILRQNGISIGAIAVLLTGGVWQKENILRKLNPPVEVINKQIVVENLPKSVELNARRIDALMINLSSVETELNDLAYYVKKKSYTRRKK